MVYPIVWFLTETQFSLVNFGKELFKICGIQLRISISYHLEFDWQIQFLNRIIEKYLRSFVREQPSWCVRFLPLAEWSYNTTTHFATSMSLNHCNL